MMTAGKPYLFKETIPLAIKCWRITAIEAVR